MIYNQLITSEHPLLIGNASLLFGNIIHQSSAHIFLQKTFGIEKIISQLLKLVEQSWLTKPARKNVAIFITKLVKSNERFELKNKNRSFIYFVCIYFVFI